VNNARHVIERVFNPRLGLVDSARHVIKCILNSRSGLMDIARHLINRILSPRFLKQVKLLADSAQNVMRCHLTVEKRVQNAFDDVASTMYKSVVPGLFFAGAAAHALDYRKAGASIPPLLTATSDVFVTVITNRSPQKVFTLR